MKERFYVPNNKINIIIRRDLKMSIIISEDKSYLSAIDLLSIEKGIAKLGIHSIRFSAELTEEQRQENRRMSDILTREQWSERCDQHKKNIGQKIEKVINLINENYVIYQYLNESINYSKGDWDLFFWCNCNKDNSRDMSYVTLNTNKKRTIEQQITDINNVLELIKTVECDSIGVDIQYTVEYDKEKVKEIVTAQYQIIKDKFISYLGSMGKIKEVGTSYKGDICYGFFKKGASKKYYQVSDSTFLQMAFNS
jgi:hypothetical protein